MDKKTIIQAKHLKKSFGKGDSLQTIYSDLNVDIYEGDFTVIMGQEVFRNLQVISWLYSEGINVDLCFSKSILLTK